MFDEFCPPRIPTHLNKPKKCKRSKDGEHIFSYCILSPLGFIIWKCDNCGKHEYINTRQKIDWDRVYSNHLIDMEGVDIVLYMLLNNK
jgi:hypothetical protein